jgi:hypothetical protein
LTALLSSKSGKFTYSEKFTYPVLWGLRVDAADKFVQLSPGRTSHDVRVHTTQRLDVQIDDSIRPYVRTSFDDATATFTIHFSAAPNPAQGRVQLIDPATNIMDFIDYAYITEEEAYFDTSSLQPVDIFITGAVIGTFMMGKPSHHVDPPLQLHEGRTTQTGQMVELIKCLV